MLGSADPEHIYSSELYQLPKKLNVYEANAGQLPMSNFI